MTFARQWSLFVLTVGALTALNLFCTRPAAAQEVRQEFVRVTFYNLPGRMFDGQMVHEGAAACSRWMPLGTVLEFEDGRQVVCHDRGHGDYYWAGWVDVWQPTRAAGAANITRAYGDYAWLSVVRWGWE